MLSAIEHILNVYEESTVTKLYKLTRDEFIYLYLVAEGYAHSEIMDYLNCQKDKLYRLRAKIIRKTKANNLHHALSIYSRAESHAKIKK